MELTDQQRLELIAQVMDLEPSEIGAFAVVCEYREKDITSGGQLFRKVAANTEPEGILVLLTSGIQVLTDGMPGVFNGNDLDIPDWLTED